MRNGKIHFKIYQLLDSLNFNLSHWRSIQNSKYKIAMFGISINNII